MTGTRNVRLGMIVMPEYLQSEGVEAVLDNIVRVAGATAVTIVPSVMEPADAATGAREPPVDGGAGTVRLLDRPLWGKRAQFVRTAPSFVPDPSLYTDSPYAPPPVSELTRREGPVVARFLAACKARGIQTRLQMMAAIPPGVRVQFGGPDAQDIPLTVGGQAVPGRVDANGSLASPAIRAYIRALIADLSRAYPDADGFTFDWPEYPPYHFDSLLFDYNPSVAPVARRLGFDLDAVREGMLALRRHLPEGLSHAGLTAATATIAEVGLDGFIDAYPALRRHFELRAALVADFAAFLAQAVADAGDKSLFLQSFPPPWNRLSGFDLARIDGRAPDIGVKLYTMHWPMIEANYIDRLVAHGARDRSAVMRLVRAALGATSTPVPTEDSIRYPEPDENHPADDAAIARKLAVARAGVKTSTFWAIAHGYGPIADVERRFRCALAASSGHVFINRYGYLSDAKLAMLGRVMGEMQDMHGAGGHRHAG